MWQSRQKAQCTFLVPKIHFLSMMESSLCFHHVRLLSFAKGKHSSYACVFHLAGRSVCLAIAHSSSKNRRCAAGVRKAWQLSTFNISACALRSWSFKGRHKMTPVRPFPLRSLSAHARIERSCSSARMQGVYAVHVVLNPHSCFESNKQS